MSERLDLLELRNDLLDIIKLTNEYHELKKKLESYEIEIQRLKNENESIKKDNQKYKTDNESKDLQINDLKLKIKKLKEKNTQIRKSVSLKDLDPNIKDTTKFKPPLKKSKSITKILDDDLDPFFNSMNDTTPTSNKLLLQSNFHEKRDKLELYDAYFKDNNMNNNDNSTNKSEKTEPITLVNSINDQKSVKISDTQLFILESENEKDKEQTNSVYKTEAIKIAKSSKQKKALILPFPQPIPELMKEIKSSDIDQIDPIVTRVLAESHPSLTALKKRYLDIINSFAVSIKSTDNIDDIHQVISFFIKFSMRISPESFEKFKKSVSSNHKLTSAISAIEETNGIF